MSRKRVNQTEWLQQLQGLVPLEHILAVANLPEDAPELEAYQQAVWQAHSVLRSLHIEQAFKSILPMLDEQGRSDWAHVLDVGCGAAIKARFLLENGASTVTGIELDDEELQLAQQFPNPWGDSLRLVQSDVLEPLPFSDETFDHVMICDGHIDFYTQEVFEELLRVLKKGGRFILLTTNLLPSIRYVHNRAFAGRVEAARWASLEDTLYAELALKGESYEARFLSICEQFGFSIGHHTIERRNPVPIVFEHLIQQTFACFDAHILREHLSKQDWEHLLQLHNPHSSHYLFQQPTALFIDMLTVAIRSKQN